MSASQLCLQLFSICLYCQYWNFWHDYACQARPESRPHQPSPLSVPLPVTQHSSLGSNLRTAQAANLSANAQNSASEVSNAQQATAGGLLTGHVNRRFPMAKRPKEVKLEPDDSSVSSSNGEVDASASPLTFSEGTAKEVDEFLKWADCDLFCRGNFSWKVLNIVNSYK